MIIRRLWKYVGERCLHSFLQHGLRVHLFHTPSFDACIAAVLVFLLSHHTPSSLSTAHRKPLFANMKLTTTITLFAGLASLAFAQPKSAVETDIVNSGYRAIRALIDANEEMRKFTDEYQAFVDSPDSVNSAMVDSVVIENFNTNLITLDQQASQSIVSVLRITIPIDPARIKDEKSSRLSIERQVPLEDQSKFLQALFREPKQQKSRRFEWLWSRLMV
jgi:hypothetical protein